MIFVARMESSANPGRSGCAAPGIRVADPRYSLTVTKTLAAQSALMPAALMMGHHFSISAFW
jgi:hypothetical protein